MFLSNRSFCKMTTNMSRIMNFTLKALKIINLDVFNVSNYRNSRFPMIYKLIHHIPIFYVTIRLFYPVVFFHESIHAQLHTNFFVFLYLRLLRENTLLWISVLILIEYTYFLEFVLNHAIDFASACFDDCLTVKTYLESNSIYGRHFIFLFPGNPGIIFKWFANLKLYNTNNYIRKYKFVQRSLLLRQSCRAALVLIGEYLLSCLCEFDSYIFVLKIFH